MSFPSIDWSRIYSVEDPEAGWFQEDAVQKQAWLGEAQKAFPVGSVVTLRDHPPGKEEHGRVIGYDACDDEGGMGLWPTVQVFWFRGATCAEYDDHIEHADPLVILADALEER